MVVKNNIGVVIVAAGRGERAGGLTQGPKQYRNIGNKPVILHTVSRFLEADPNFEIAIVIHRDDDALLKAALGEILDKKNIHIVIGGKTRQSSVYNGLLALENFNLPHVMIHDGVRPFVGLELIERCVNTLRISDAILPALSVADTLKRVDDNQIIIETVSRDKLFRAQTPQCFNYSQILKAHEEAANNLTQEFTDDCALAEWAGMKVSVIEGEAQNQKITFREDIEMADLVLNRKTSNLPDVRVGNGYDVHSTVPGDHVILCGVSIPNDQSLFGHSDADVGLHALTDALLATCSAGDIGDHFPPTDPQWKGAESHIFLSHAAKIVHDAGGTIMNIDISLICETPKIGPHREKMRKRLAEILNIDLVRCSVKATTNEKIGFLGRREGIAAIATASVVYS